jgi:hypothetical protein
MPDVRGRRVRAAGRGQANGATLRADKIAGAYENILTSRESHFGAPTCSACLPRSAAMDLCLPVSFHLAGGTIWSERDIDARWRDGDAHGCRGGLGTAAAARAACGEWGVSIFEVAQSSLAEIY